MERLTGNDTKLMMEALAAVYEKKGDCIDKDKKTKHNCAKKVCSEQWGEGTCVPEHHTLLEDGTVTHYDVVFEHGLERMVPIQELEVLVTEMHEHASMEGELVDEGINDDPRSGFIGQVGRLGAKMFGNASQRNNAVSYERSINDLTKKRGGGNVPQGADGKPITAAQIAAETKRRRLADPKYKPGQGVDSGAKPGSGGTRPATPSNSAVASRSSAPAPAPAPAKDRMANASKEDRMSAWAKANPKLAAAAKERARTRGTNQTTNPMMKDMKSRLPAPKTGPGSTPKPAAAGAAIKPGANAAGSMKPGANAAGSMKPGAAFAGGKRPATGSPAAQAAAGAPNRKEDLFTGKPIPKKPVGSPAAQAAAGAPNRKEDLFTGKPIPAAKPAAAKPAAGGRAAELAAIRAKAKADTMKGARNRMEEIEVFDIIKGHLIDEGYSEDEALKVMSILTDEERIEIIEGQALQNTNGGY